MVEGGRIDWACHRNDLAAQIYELLDFNDAVAIGYNFYLEHPDDTMLIVTGDHVYTGRHS